MERYGVLNVELFGNFNRHHLCFIALLEATDGKSLAKILLWSYQKSIRSRGAFDEFSYKWNMDQRDHTTTRRM
jgi:hypothetical protein